MVDDNLKGVLKKSGCIVLRNYDKPGKDFDILVSKDYNFNFDDNGFKEIFLNPACNKRLFINKGVKYHFHVGGVSGRHVRYLDFKDFDKPKKHNGFLIPQSQDEFLVIFLHQLLDCDKLQLRYVERLKELRAELGGYIVEKIDLKLWDLFNSDFSSLYHDVLDQACGCFDFPKGFKKLSRRARTHFFWSNFPESLEVFIKGGLWKWGRGR